MEIITFLCSPTKILHKPALNLLLSQSVLVCDKVWDKLWYLSPVS